MATRPSSRRGPDRSPRRQAARTERPGVPGRGRSGWSRTRKIRLARTVVVVVVVALLAWNCTRSNDGSGDSDTPPTTEQPSRDEVTGTPTEFAGIGFGITQRDPGIVLPAPVHRGAGGSVDGVTLYVGGITHPVDEDTERFDESRRVTTDAIWRVDGLAASQVGSLPAPRRDHAAAPLRGALMVAGGEEDGAVTDNIVMVSPDGSVAEAGPLPGARTQATAVGSSDGTTAYIVGGTNGSSPTDDVLATNDGVAFFPVGNLAVSVNRPAVALIGELLWIAGGSTDGEDSTIIQTMNVATGEAAAVAELPTPRVGAAGFTLAGAFFVAGGRTDGDPVADVARIDPETYEVTATGALARPVAEAAVTQTASVVRLHGGATLMDVVDPDTGADDGDEPLSGPAVSGSALLSTVLELSG